MRRIVEKMEDTLGGEIYKTTLDFMLSALRKAAIEAGIVIDRVLVPRISSRGNPSVQLTGYTRSDLEISIIWTMWQTKVGEYEVLISFDGAGSYTHSENRTFESDEVTAERIALILKRVIVS